MGPVGLDLGTSHSRIAVLNRHKVEMVRDPAGAVSTPSTVARVADGSWLAGVAAQRQAVTNPADTVRGAKRVIGRPFASPAVRGLNGSLPFGVVPGQAGEAWIRVGQEPHSPVDLCSRLIRHLKELAGACVGASVSRAVIAVPSSFDEAQREAVRAAGRGAGLEVSAVISEAAAVALAYGARKPLSNELLAVFDAGAGFCSISIFRIDGHRYELLAGGGDMSVGGDDFDRILVDALVEQAAAQHGVSLADDPMAMQRLREAAEKIKRDLSAMASTDAQIPYIAQTDGAPVHLERSVTRAWFEQRAARLLDRFDEPCARALSSGGVSAGDIAHVVFVGGMSRMPAVRDRIGRLIGQPEAWNVHPEEMVATGAALYAASLDRALDTEIALSERPAPIPAAVPTERAPGESDTLRIGAGRVSGGAGSARGVRTKPIDNDSAGGLAGDNPGGGADAESSKSERSGADLSSNPPSQRTRRAMSSSPRRAGYGFVSQGARRVSRSFAASRQTSRVRGAGSTTRGIAKAVTQIDPVERDYTLALKADFFGRLGLHWTDSPTRLQPALETLRRRYGPSSSAAKSNAEFAAKRLELAEAAFKELSSPHARRAYRAEQLRVDVQAAAELLDQQARLDLRRDDLNEAIEKLTAAQDLAPTEARRAILAKVRPP